MTKASRARAVARRLDPTLVLPVDDARYLPVEFRRQVAAKSGATMDQVVSALQSDPAREGMGAGRKSAAESGRARKRLETAKVVAWLRACGSADAAHGVETGCVDLWTAPDGTPLPR